MLSAYRLFRFDLLCLVLGSSLLFHAAGAATLCTGLPPSTLQVIDLRTSTVGEARVPADELERRGQTGDDLASRHTMMLSVSNVVTWFDVTHRIMPGADGAVCDAPTLVRIGFGSSQRFAFLASAAAEDRCVRQRMLDHEAAHTRALDAVVEQFIDRQRGNFQRGVAALKQTPAPTAVMAKTWWEGGLRAMVIEARDQLFTELRSTFRQIDTPASLAALENACGGRIRELQQHTGHF